MPFLSSEIYGFQGTTSVYGVGSLSKYVLDEDKGR